MFLRNKSKNFHPKLFPSNPKITRGELKSKLGSTKLPEVYFGVEGAKQVATISEVQTVMSSIVGSAGLLPTIAAIEAKKNIGLANKESMVVAGAYVSKKAQDNGVTILPVDSEHSAIFQSLAGAPMKQVRRLILTASGGPFYLKKDLDLSTVKKEQALKHPNWSMGNKITIDSATLMNKGLEVIEAKWLFDTPISKIDVVIHPQSIVHSMVEYVDGSIIAQLG
jgi:1-deoxy-D-xylulose-5-phosphate reductoisomerase